MTCPTCEGEREIHDADFSNGDSDQQMYLMQDTLRPCPDCTTPTKQIEAKMSNGQKRTFFEKE